MIKKQKTSQVDMTEGVIWKQFLTFSMPLLVGNIFQQLYNTVDSIVVGNFIGSQALAAVGSSGSLIGLIIGMFMGIGTGAGVIISQYYGARDEKKLGLAVHTTMALSVIGGLIMIVAGVCLSPFILKLMGTPDEVLHDSVVYLRVFFWGSLFNLLYNMGSGILRSVGDSVRPLIYLCVSSIVNIILDLIFVVILKCGIAGVGYATVIAQAVSSILTIWTLVTTKESYRLVLAEIKIHKHMMMRILKLGLPSGLQQSIISLSNVIVQTNVNSFGYAAMAGFGAYSKVNGFAMLPLQSFSIAATTFTGQNIGAKKIKRVKKGIFQAIVISLIYTALISFVLFFNSKQILRIFSPDQSVISFGYATMLIMLPFYCVIAIHQIFMGSFLGNGRSIVTMFIGVGNMCILRMIYINCLVPFSPSFEAVLWCYPITWLTAVAMDWIYCLKAKWLPKDDE